MITWWIVAKLNSMVNKEALTWNEWQSHKLGSGQFSPEGSVSVFVWSARCQRHLRSRKGKPKNAQLQLVTLNLHHYSSMCTHRHVAPLPARLVTQESLSYNMCCVQSEPGSSCLRTACWWCRFKISPERKRGWKAWLQKWTPKVLCIDATVRCHLTYFILQLFNRNPLWTACAHERCHLVNTISQVKWPSH